MPQSVKTLSNQKKKASAQNLADSDPYKITKLFNAVGQSRRHWKISTIWINPIRVKYLPTPITNFTSYKNPFSISVWKVLGIIIIIIHSSVGVYY